MLLHLKSVFLALLALPVLLNHSAAVAQPTPRVELDCDGVEARLQDARRAGDSAALEDWAEKYVVACRPSRNKTELSMAMGDIAAIRRSASRFQESLRLSMECIKFEYLALGCHIEKSLSLNGLGMRSEAKEVLKTAADVLAQLKNSGSHEMAQAEELRARVKPDDYEMRDRKAKAKLWMANQGEPYLRSVIKVLG